MSSKLVTVCRAEDVPRNSIRRAEIGEKSLAIYNIDGVFYATDERCTHGLWSLAQGTLEGEEVECSLHFGRFHVPTGKPTGRPCSVPVKTYRTQVIEGQILVEIENPS